MRVAFQSYWQAKPVMVPLLQVPHASVNHVPTLTGGKGHEELRRFYSQSFIPAFPGQALLMTPCHRCTPCQTFFSYTAVQPLMRSSMSMLHLVSGVLTALRNRELLRQSMQLDLQATQRQRPSIG